MFVREKMTDLSFFPSEMFDKKFRYDGGDLGAQCGQEGTSFKVWSPFAEEVTLRLYRDGSSESFLERQLEIAEYVHKNNPGDRQKPGK